MGGVEVSAIALAEAKKRCSELLSVQLVECDALGNKEELWKIAADATCVFIDVGGDRLLGKSLELLQAAVEALNPHLICIKNRALWNFAQEKSASDSTVLLAAAELMCGASGPTAFDNLRYQKEGARDVKGYPKCLVPGSDRAICR